MRPRPLAEAGLTQGGRSYRLNQDFSSAKISVVLIPVLLRYSGRVVIQSDPDFVHAIGYI